MGDDQHVGGRGKDFYRRRAESLLWPQLEPGETLLETCFAQLDAPGALGLTDRRVLFVGRGLFFRRSPRLASIPRAEISKMQLELGRLDNELHVLMRDGGALRFFDVNADEAERLVAMHTESPIEPTDAQLQVVGHGPKGKLVPLFIIGGGAVVTPWQPLVGLGIVLFGIVYALIRRTRASRIDLRGQARDS